ncbi:MAG: amidohydrolase family protein, partial [Planctomycetaceae bacterium]
MTSTQPQPIVRDVDREFFDRELASFVPERIFDAHCHLWNADHYQVKLAGMPRDAGYDEYREMIDALHPGRSVRALFIPMPSQAEVIPRANDWIAKQTGKAADCRGLFFVRPDDDPEWVRQEVRRLGLCGLKCYHTMSPIKPTWEASIETFLPEKFLSVANEEGWAITLHLVKSRAVADGENIACIRRYCQTYPNMKLILAHSA